MSSDLNEPMLPPDYSHDEISAPLSSEAERKQPSVWRHIGMAVAVVLVISVVAVTATQAGHSTSPKAKDASPNAAAQGPGSNNYQPSSSASSKFATTTTTDLAYDGVMHFASSPSLRFHVDGTDAANQSFSLHTIDFEHLFSFLHKPDNSTLVKIGNVSLHYSHNFAASEEQLAVDHAAMAALFDHPAMTSLPAFSYAMGTQYGASAKAAPMMHAVHMLALSHHKVMGSELPDRRRSCPDQTCTSGSGHPLSSSACNSNCVGMCGKVRQNCV